MQLKAGDPLVLLSGLPLGRKPSFLRQLEALAAVWKRRGRTVSLAGPVYPHVGSRCNPASGEPLWLLSDGGPPVPFERLAAQSRARAVIALGYPDQFPFSRASPREASALAMPCYLWAQFSRPPSPPPAELPIYVPLTARTSEILHAAGGFRIGPVIPHGVDTAVFAPLTKGGAGQPVSSADQASRFVVGTVGANTRRKRFDLIIRAFAMFSRRCPSARLLIKTNRLVSLDGIDLGRLIRRERIEDRVEIVVEEMEEVRMAELYRRMDLYLNLSEWEGFCIPVIEAMASGVPVAAPQIQGPGEILPYRETLIPGGTIRDQEGSMLLEADPASACRVLGMLADDFRLRRRLSRRGREEAVNRYEIGRIASLWEELLR